MNVWNYVPNCQGKSMKQAKDSFNISQLDYIRKKLIKCYIWSIALYSAETWIFKKIEQTAWKFWNVVLEEDIDGKMEGIERQGRRHKQLLDDPETRQYWKLKKEELDCTLWRTCFGKGYGPVVKTMWWWWWQWWFLNNHMLRSLHI